MDIKRSDLPMLLSLDALLDELNVTRAARRLNISQSALSGQLARLRDLFDDPLLVPSENGRGMVPTPRAIELRPRLGEALAQLKMAVTDVATFEAASARRTFVVASNDSVFTIIGLHALVAVVAERNPQLRIAVVPAGDGMLVERMERGEIDLFLGDVDKVPESLKLRFLLSDGFRMAQGKQHPRGRRPATLDEYCQLRHVMVSQRAQFHSPIDDVLADIGCSRQIAVVVPSYNQVALVLAHTECVASLPRQLLERYASTLDILPLPFEVPRFNLAMAWHPRAQHDDALRWLRDSFLQALPTAEVV